MLSYIITHYRSIFALFCLTPAAGVHNLYLRLRRFLLSRSFTVTSHEAHAERVEQIRKEVKDANGRICSNRGGNDQMTLTIGDYKKRSKKVNLSCLRSVFEFNEKEKFIWVEPMVDMGDLTSLLIPRGYTLPILPELDNLTVGGLLAGTGIETASHIYGLFHHIVEEIEIVLADGTLERVSRTQNPELFQNIPWSYGTLGMITGVKVQIVPCKPLVRLNYEFLHTKEEFLKQYDKECRDPSNDFVEALAYSIDNYALMTGKMVDKVGKDGLFNPLGKFYKQWFYLHVEDLMMRKNTCVEYIPLKDYYHRHTKSLFWEVREIMPFGHHVWFRYLLGWMMPISHKLFKATRTEELTRLYKEKHIVQDMIVPIKSLGECLDVVNNMFRVYPLWLCPTRIFEKPSDQVKGLICGLEEDDLFIDVGIYGTPAKEILKNYNAERDCRRLEDYVRKVNGVQMLYADCYATKDEFRSMFNHQTYDRLRKEIPLTKERFPEIYDKVYIGNRH